MEEVKRMHVMLADEQSRVRSALRLLLEEDPHYWVVDEATEAEELIEKVRNSSIEMVLVDWRLPGLAGEELLSALRALGRDLVIVVLSGRPESQPLAIAAGADAFVSKADPPEQLLTTLQSVCGNE